jgi:small subunit ribosomal protein S1
MDIQDNEKNKINEIIEPDEGWWAAVLADEPCVEDLEQPIDSVIAARHDLVQADQSKSSVDWEKIERIFKSDEIVTLSVVGYNRGGILVADEDIHGFVPSSHLIDVPADSTEEEREHYFTSYIDSTVSLKIIECEPEKERVVFSERAALAGEGQRLYLLKNLKKGDVVTGVVTNVTDFGGFVDLGGLEGLIHVSELSWGRVQHPSDILNVGDEVEVLVLQVSEEEGRIALSLKRLNENPWDVLSKELSPGDHVEAEISSIVKYGAFVKLEEGIEGLIHISSMNFPKGCTHIDDFLYEGQPVNVCVIHIDPEKRRLGLRLVSYSTE